MKGGGGKTFTLGELNAGFRGNGQVDREKGGTWGKRIGRKEIFSLTFKKWPVCGKRGKEESDQEKKGVADKAFL